MGDGPLSPGFVSLIPGSRPSLERVGKTVGDPERASGSLALRRDVAFRP